MAQQGVTLKSMAAIAAASAHRCATELNANRIMVALQWFNAAQVLPLGGSSTANTTILVAKREVVKNSASWLIASFALDLKTGGVLQAVAWLPDFGNPWFERILGL